MKYIYIYMPMKMEPTVSSETSAIRTQMPGNYPKRNKLHLERGESLRTRKISAAYTFVFLFHIFPFHALQFNYHNLNQLRTIVVDL